MHTTGALDMRGFLHNRSAGNALLEQERLEVWKRGRLNLGKPSWALQVLGVALTGEIVLHLVMLNHVIMKKRGEAHRIDLSVCHHLLHVAQRSSTSTGNDRNGHGLRDHPGQVKVKSLAGAFTINRRHEDFARA